MECSLFTVDLENSPPSYNALSYTWGDPRTPLFQGIFPEQANRKFPLIIDGRVLYVTQNLFHALERIRNIDRNRPRPNGVTLHQYIWIDAVCINQSDVAERSSQVAMMDRIYKSAHTVVCWLGKDDRYTATALQLMHRLAYIPPEEYPRYASLGLNHSNASKQEWEALVAFFRRPYFRRAWIVQEVMLAQRLL
ncbi:heterokaryon incompatibility, partial [Zopfia rhizophila CBS 207.26]